MIIQRALSDRPVTDEDSTVALNREVIPIVRATRQYVNERFGKVTTITADYSATLDDEVILADSDSGAVTVTLPLAADAKSRRYSIKRTGALNTVTVSAQTGETIDGLLTQTLASQYYTITVVSDGDSAWHILSEIP